MIIKHRITMDFTRIDEQGYIDVMQDDKYSRDLVLYLKSNAKAYCPPEDCTVLVRYKKSNGQVGMYDTLPQGTKAWFIEEDVLTVRLAPQVCTAAGKVMLYITLLQRETELNCFAVCVNVHERPDGKYISENYFNVNGFVPQPDRAVAGEYIKVLTTDANGKVTAVTTATEVAEDGKSAYKYAQDGGYTGTEEEFAEKLAQEVPTKVSQLENDNDYAPRSELPNAFYVTVTIDSESGNTLDKTGTEIEAAYASERPIYCNIDGGNSSIPLSRRYFDGVVFLYVFQSAHGTSYQRVVVRIYRTSKEVASVAVSEGTYSTPEELAALAPKPSDAVLYVQAVSIEGTEWEDEEMFGNSANVTANAATIAQAISDGYAVYVVVDGLILPCISATSESAEFSLYFAKGMLGVSVRISETATAQVAYVLMEFPEALPNPKALTINGTAYDGSEPVDMTIEGGSGDNIPDYVRTEAERLAAVVQSRQNENTMSAILSSDYHLPNSAHTYYAQILESITHAGQAMDILRNQLSIDFEAKLGDLIWDSGETQAEALENFQLVHSLVSEGNILDRYEGNGNHDHLQSNSTPLTDSQVYANLGIFNKGCVRDADNRAGGYCYKDYEEFKLRVILVNTSEADDGSFTVSTEQVSWLGEALAVPVEEGWGTLILSHHPLDWGGSSTAVMNKVKTASGVIANLHGHVHTFTQDVITGTEIPRLAIPNVCFYRNNEYGTNGTTENSEGIEFGTTTTYSKTAGTAADTSFCVLTIDRESGKLYLDHYGAGTDREAEVPAWAKKGYTNLVPTSEAADSTEVYNDVGYKNGYYLSSNGAGEESADSACVVTGFIPYSWATDNPIYVKGASVTSESHVRIYGHTSKDHINQSCMAYGGNMSYHFTVEELEDESYYKLTPVRGISEVTYVRLSLIGTGENLIVTVNEPIEG